VDTRSPSCSVLLYASDADETAQDERVLSNVAETITRLVKEQSQARWNGDYALTDTIKEQIQQLAKDGGCDIILNDKPRKEGGGKSWHVELWN
jgi:cysteinyl-tRNA synthetase